LVPDLDPIGLDVIAVSLNGRLNQSIVASNEKVAFFHEIALLHWNLEDLSVELRRKLDSGRLLNRAATPDDLFKRLPADRRGFDSRRRIYYPGLAGVSADYMEGGRKYEKSEQKTNNKEHNPVGTLHFWCCSSVRSCSETPDVGRFARDFSFRFPNVRDFSFRFHNTKTIPVIVPKISSS
jgi:hypothetical protein